VDRALRCPVRPGKCWSGDTFSGPDIIVSENYLRARHSLIWNCGDILPDYSERFLI